MNGLEELRAEEAREYREEELRERLDDHRGSEDEESFRPVYRPDEREDDER
jgi:hypothetical protein